MGSFPTALTLRTDPLPGLLLSWMTLPNRPLCWIANPTKRKTSTPPVLASAARSAAGRPEKKTDGLVTADTNRTRSIVEASAQPVSINGLRRNAFHAADGRRIRFGTRSKSASLLGWD